VRLPAPMIRLPAFILRFNAGSAVIHIQSLARDLMYRSIPPFLPGGISRITLDYSPSNLSSHGVSPTWFRQSSLSFARLTKFSQHDHRFASDDLPLGLLIYCHATNRSRQRWSRSKNAREAWDLTSNARSAFRFLTVFPDQFPNQARTHYDVPIIEWLNSLATAQIHTPIALPCQELRSFRSSSPAYPHIQLDAECLRSTNAVPFRLMVALG